MSQSEKTAKKVKFQLSELRLRKFHLRVNIENEKKNRSVTKPIKTAEKTNKPRNCEVGSIASLTSVVITLQSIVQVNLALHFSVYLEFVHTLEHELEARVNASLLGNEMKIERYVESKIKDRVEQIGSITASSQCNL